MADVTVDHKGRILLPPWAAKLLRAERGTKLRIHSEGDRVVLERVAPFDPFAEATKKPDPDAIEQLLEEQKQEKADAEDRFAELMENPPEVREEDKPDLWR